MVRLCIKEGGPCPGTAFRTEAWSWAQNLNRAVLAGGTVYSLMTLNVAVAAASVSSR